MAQHALGVAEAFARGESIDGEEEGWIC